MGVRAYVTQLNIKHADLDRKIIAEMKRTVPDTLRISQLKREKLHVKDLIQGYAAQPAS